MIFVSRRYKPRRSERKMVEKSVEYANKQMLSIQDLGKYLPDDFRESILNIIRLELITAYRRGFNDATKFE
jgi:hypothetical protein